MNKRMKRLIVGSITTLFCVALFSPLIAFAAIDTPVPVEQVLNSVLDDGAASIADVTITRKTITDTTAEFSFSLKVKRAASITLVAAYSNEENVWLSNNRAVIGSENTPTVGQTHDANLPSPVFTDLQPATTYYFQVKDTINNVFYQKVSFTTTGTAPDTGELTTASVNEQKNALEVNIPLPDLRPLTREETSKVNAVFRGSFVTALNMNVGLDMYIGDSPGSLFKSTVPLFPAELVLKDQGKTFEFVQSQLEPGTMYYFKIHENTKNFDATDTFSFTTPGTKPGITAPFDPNTATGSILPNYEFPTNIGEPDGGEDFTAIEDEGTPLVPCGKRSDDINPGVIDPDERCGFNHMVILFQNVFTFLLIMLVPLTVLACIYTGVQMILHRSMPAELIKYKDRLLKIGVGLLVMLLAWTIVATVLSALLGADASKYLLIDIF